MVSSRGTMEKAGDRKYSLWNKNFFQESCTYPANGDFLNGFIFSFKINKKCVSENALQINIGWLFKYGVANFSKI